VRSTSKLATLVAIGLACTPPASAADGLLVVQRVTTNGTARTTEIQIEVNRMRAEVDEAGQGLRVVVFDATEQVMRLIDPARKSYTEMTKADVDRMGSQLSDMQAKMEAMFQNMPPEQRAKMEAMMKGRGMPPGAGMGQAVRMQYRKTGTSKVGKWACDTYEGQMSGKKVSEICAVSPQTLGFREADFAVTAQLAEFFRGLMPQGADAIFQAGRPEQQGYSGIPVRQVTTAGGREVVSDLVEVKRQSFADAIFAVPAGYKKDSMPFGPR
jgi:hypothetical protein